MSDPDPEDTDTTPAGAPRRRIAPLTALGVAVMMIGLFVILAGSKARQSSESAFTKFLGKPAPQIDAPTVDGSTFNLASERGNVVVLNFFQTTCAPCKLEHPELVKFAAQQAALPHGAKMVSVIFDDKVDPVKAFFAANGGSWPVVNATGTASTYGVAQVPETFVIDENGIVDFHSISPMTATCLTELVSQAQGNPPAVPKVC